MQPMPSIQGWILTLLVFGQATFTTANAQQAEEAGLRLNPPSFVYARYATASPASLYGARSFGPVGGFVGMVQSRQTQYRELIAGVYTQVNWDGQSILLALGYAEATESPYLQTYILPSLSLRRLALSGTIEWYEPVRRSGIRQLDVNPVSLVVQLNKRVRLGAASTLGLARGMVATRRVGPMLQLTAPWGTVKVEVLRRSSGRPTEVRTAVVAPF
jgi:hypothetical protein